MKKRRWLAWLLLGVIALAVLPLTVSLVGLRGSVARAFERQWGRSVDFSRLRFQFLPEPALRAYGVKIGEIEAFGAEPFVHAEEARCQLKLFPLLRGGIECARLHLLRPSLNLVRTADGSWNFAAWAREASGIWPTLSAEEGRINFKQGAEKRIYALVETRFTLERSGDTWHLSLEAQPFRSDRRLTETGTAKLTATLRPSHRVGEPVSLDASWELGPGALSQWVEFVTGRDLPVRAHVYLRGRLAGTRQKFSLAGDFRLEELHRWDLVPGRRVPRWQGQYKLNSADFLRDWEIVRVQLTSGSSTVELRGRVKEILQQPDWNLEIASASLALDELLAQYAALTANVSPETRLEGNARLTAQLVGPVSEWKASLVLHQPARWRVPAIRGGVRLDPAEIRWQRGRLEAGSLRLVFPGEQVLELKSRVFPQDSRWFARVEARSPALELGQAVTAARALGWNLWGESEWQGNAQVNLQWRGDLQAWPKRRQWGSLEFRQVSFRPSVVNRLLEIETARVEFAGSSVRITPLLVRLGEATLAGEVARSRPEGPWTLDLTLERLVLDDLDALLNPGRARGLLGTLLPSPPPRMGWEHLRARGQIAVDSLQAGPFELAQFRSEVEWKERQLALRGLVFRLLGGRFRGSFQGDFRARPPAYRLAGNLRQLELNRMWPDGPVSQGSLAVNLVLQTAGYAWEEFRRNARGTLAGVVTDATLTPFNLLAALRAAADLPSEETDAETRTPVQSLAGEIRVANRSVRFEGVRMVVERAALDLSGEVSFEGRLNLRVRGEPLLVAGIEPSPAEHQLLAHTFAIRGSWREPEVRIAGPAGRR